VDILTKKGRYGKQVAVALFVVPLSLHSFGTTPSPLQSLTQLRKN